MDTVIFCYALYTIDSRYLEVKETLKYEISVPRHIRFAELREKIEQPHVN